MTAIPSYLPTADRVLEIHAFGMKKFGGAKNWTANRSCVESAIGATWNAALYTAPGDEPDPFQCAVHLFCHLNKNHCFTDGVKRVSWMTLCECLMNLGLRVNATQEEAANFVQQHAGGEGLQVEIASAWIEPRLSQA